MRGKNRPKPLIAKILSVFVRFILRRFRDSAIPLTLRPHFTPHSLPMRCILLVFLCLPFFSPAQLEKKKLPAVKIEGDIRVDGHLNDSLWQYAPVGQNFRELIPGNGDTIPPEFRTEMRVLYSDEAIYFGITMHDPHPDSILTQLTQRDVYQENNDFILISINPYNDGLNDFNFAVTAAGTQADSRTTASGDDPSLNSIWYSAVRITDFGWTAELKIPYISLRFPEKAAQDWGLNMVRAIRRNRHQYSWNFIDRGSGYSAEYQAGLLTGVEGIEPPVRLSLMPYVSAYADDFRNQTTYDFNAGLDLKYGLNQNFTLDMTLIPDFGQVAFDNQFLNLSPFENRFQENRQFFTEGTDLFTIGDLFYSRRIGGAPQNITNQNFNDSNITEVRTEFTRLLNATKLSGRTQGNLGIGVLNAVTDNNYSVRVDEEGNTNRQLLEPLTNYNVFVLDQRFNRNSSVSFVNTNVLRNGEYMDANVAGLLTSIFTPSGQFRVDASLKRSDQIEPGNTLTGYEGEVRFGDVDGHWRWATLQRITTDDYNINDLGFQTRNNQIRNYSEVEYLTFKPKGPFNRTSYTFYSIYSSLYQPQRFEEFTLGFNSFFLLRDFTGTGLNFNFNPVSRYDYFEPRLPGRYFRRPARGSVRAFISTDYRKPLAIDARILYDHVPEFERHYYSFDLEPRIRLGDHFFMIPRLTYNWTHNDYGFAASIDGESFFGRREVRQLTLDIGGRYVFNPVSTLSLQLRQFWSPVRYEEFFLLQDDGSLRPVDIENQYDINFNTFNIDLRYSWWFAPASEMSILYRVALVQSGNEAINDYAQNLETAFAVPVQNNLSIKINYLLDYNRTRNYLRKRQN